MAAWTRLQAKEQVLKWQSVGNVVVFTNGCFDVLHRGHIDYLTEAKALGNKLIIGLNSDASVLLLKGEGRPVQPEDGTKRRRAQAQMVNRGTQPGDPR